MVYFSCQNMLWFIFEENKQLCTKNKKQFGNENKVKNELSCLSKTLPQKALLCG